MIVEYVRYDLVAHQPEKLVSAYATAVDSLRASPECLAFELTQCEEAPRSFVLRIEWASTEAHLQGFRKGPNFPPFLSAIRPFIGEIAEMRHYAATPLVWKR